MVKKSIKSVDRCKSSMNFEWLEMNENFIKPRRNLGVEESTIGKVILFNRDSRGRIRPFTITILRSTYGQMLITSLYALDRHYNSRTELVYEISLALPPSGHNCFPFVSNFRNLKNSLELKNASETLITGNRRQDIKWWRYFRSTATRFVNFWHSKLLIRNAVDKYVFRRYYGAVIELA